MANHDDDDGLIRQPHGGALRAFTMGNGQSSARAPWRSTRKAALALMHDATPQAVQVLVDALGSPDERVRVVASEQLLNRMLGKPGLLPQANDADGSVFVDLSLLTEAERTELANALDTIARLTGRTIGRPDQ